MGMFKFSHSSYMKDWKKIIALTGWATWWHIFPLLSVYSYLKEEGNFEFIWVWQEDSLEEEIAVKNRILFLDIPAGKIRRYFDLRNIYEPFKNLTGIFFGIYYIIKYKIDIIFSKWWYVALPLCIAGFLLRKRVFIHESDTVWWITNKIIEKFATKVFYTFPNEKILKNPKKYIEAGQILNPDLLESLTDLDVVENERLSVLIIWWTQGSTTIFKAMLNILWDFSDVDFQVVLWEKNMHFREDFKKFPNILVHDFLTQKRLGKILKETDIAITRWWATTLWELTSFGVHSIIIPLKWSAGNHQEENAKYFHEKFWSDVLSEDNLEIELRKRLESYKKLRKWWLNLEWFYDSLRVIEKEIY